MSAKFPTLDEWRENRQRTAREAPFATAIKRRKWLCDPTAREAIAEWIADGDKVWRLDAALLAAARTMAKPAAMATMRAEAARRDREMARLGDFVEWLADHRVFDSQNAILEALTSTLSTMSKDARVRDARHAGEDSPFIVPRGRTPSHAKHVKALRDLGLTRDVARQILADLRTAVPSILTPLLRK